MLKISVWLHCHVVTGGPLNELEDAGQLCSPVD